MDAIQVNAVLLRGIFPDLPLTVGSTMVGRVLERHQAHGLLNLAGAVLVAELPENVEAGARLRLAVSEVTADRIALRITGEVGAQGAPAQQAAPQAQQAQLGTPVAVPVPAGAPGAEAAQAFVQAIAEEPGPGDPAGRTKAVTIRYDSPALGRIEVRLALGANGLVAGVGAQAGEPIELAGEHAGELRSALAGALGVPVDVHVGLRRERVDFRA
jgi:hypothetical protein